MDRRELFRHLAQTTGKELVAVDPLVGAKTEWEMQGDKLLVRNAQDAEPIIEANKAELNSGEDGYSKSRNLRRVASIPLVLYLDLKKRGILGDRVKFRRWLNDPDNRLFRTAPGKV